MDFEKLIEAVRLCGSTPKVNQCKQCAYWAGGDMSKCIPVMTSDVATALSMLQAENEKLRETVDKYAVAASVIALHLKPFCDKSLTYDEMIADASRKASAELEQTKAERDAAIKTIFQWTGCPECKYWDSADEWCEKHDREANSCGGCGSPEWRGPVKED